MEGLEVHRRFGPTPVAVREARAFLRDCLDALARHVDFDVDAVLLAANELATNAVVHGGTEFEVRVRLHDGTVRVEVTDHDPRLPQARTAGADATSGRGLALIDSSGLHWGADRTDDGKTVWLAVPAGVGAGARRPAAPAQSARRG